MGAIRAGALGMLVVVVGGLVLITAGGYAYAANAPVEELTVTNETATVNYSDPTTLDEHAPYLTYEPGSVTARNDSATTLAEGTDYEFYPANGTIDWLNTSRTSAGETAFLDYNATYHPQEARLARSVVGAGIMLAVFLPLVVLALAVAGALVTLTTGGVGR